MRRNRFAALAAILALVVPAAAQAQTFWDFVALNGAPPSQGPTSQARYVTPPGQQVFNGSESVTFNALLGAGSNPSNSALVVFQWYNNINVIGDEKGVGACMQFGTQRTPTCNAGGEIGEDYNRILNNGAQWLILDMNGLSNTNTLLSITLASLTNLDSYFFEVCSTGNADGSGFTGCTPYAGAPGSVNILTINLLSADQSKRWARFSPGPTGDYVVQGITTSLPEPGTMGLLATGLVALAGVGALRKRQRKS